MINSNWHPISYRFGVICGRLFQCWTARCLNKKTANNPKNSKIYLWLNTDKLSYYAMERQFCGFRTTPVLICCLWPGDSLSDHVGSKFDTKDKKDDETDDNTCASLRHGGWWFKGCQLSNLNGQFERCDFESRAANILWWDWTCKYSLNFTEMKIKPFYNWRHRRLAQDSILLFSLSLNGINWQIEIIVIISKISLSTVNKSNW